MRTLPGQDITGVLGSSVFVFFSLILCFCFSQRLPSWETKAVPYLAFKILSHFLASSPFLLQQSLKRGQGTVFPQIPDVVLCFSESMLYSRLCWMCPIFFVFVQEVNRKKISENIDYLELWIMQVCLGQCVLLAPRSSKIFLCKGFWRDSFQVLSRDIWHLANLKCPVSVFSRKG